MEENTKLSPFSLAFLGDAVYSLFVREKLAKTNLPIKELNEKANAIVSAVSQAKTFEIIKNLLTKEETEIFKRGRNIHTNNRPKSATVAEYHIATGFETLMGYLYIEGKIDRIKELIDKTGI